MYRRLEIVTILMPPLLIGGFEFVRHLYLLPYISMKTGNFIITGLTLVLSFLYTTWVFRIIRRQQTQLAEEQSRTAVYEERERLASELHDGIAQTLFFLGVKLKQGRIDEAQNAIAMIDDNVRQAIFNLRSLPDTGGGLRDRLCNWLDKWSTMTDIEVEPKLVSLADGRFTPTQEVLLFNIIQEAFNNIRKHSHAQKAGILFQDKPRGGWQMLIWDDGRGICEPSPEANQYGLTIMAERAEKLGAVLEIGRRARGGTDLLIKTHGGGRR